MNKYALKTKTGEIISYVKAEDIFEASQMFADKKRIETKALLKIFIVELV